MLFGLMCQLYSRYIWISLVIIHDNHRYPTTSLQSKDIYLAKLSYKLRNMQRIPAWRLLSNDPGTASFVQVLLIWSFLENSNSLLSPFTLLFIILVCHNFSMRILFSFVSLFSCIKKIKLETMNVLLYTSPQATVASFKTEPDKQITHHINKVNYSLTCPL